MTKFFKGVNWTNALFLTFVPLIGVFGTIALIDTHAIHWQTILLAIFYFIAGGISITAGYHRLYAHRTYKAAWPVRLFFLLFGASTFEGSVREWSTDHRRHHRYVDTDKDPYNINKGFWWAHMGWLFKLDASARDYTNVQDVDEDPLALLQDKYFVRIGVFMSAILPVLICMLWGDPIGGFVIVGALRTSLVQHVTFCINSICHLFGGRTYTDRQTARDNWITAFVTFGEGYHNFHHQFALDYRNGVRKYQFDPSKWLIFAMSKMGLASGLRRVSSQKILAYRMRMDSKRLEIAATRSSAMKTHIGEVMNPMQEVIEQMILRVEELEKGYQQLQAQKLEYFKGKMDEYKQSLQDYQQRLRYAKLDLRRNMTLWTRMVRRTERHHA